MERYTSNNKMKKIMFGLTGVAMACSSAMATAAGNGNGNGNGEQSYSFSGTCAFLPADRATEFHGNPATSKLNLGMAGNQWVVFDKVMQAFNLSQGNDPTQPDHRDNDANGFTLADLNDASNQYFIELIPPGQIRKQIKSGCMLLGNDEDRNFLPGNLQVDFDVFASTNYNLMQDLANNGFIDEAVPYIRNRLDLMVVAANGTGNPGDMHIGTDRYTADADFDKQFDIVMDLLSGDVVTNKLDHINEGIHNAANGYMGKVSNYIRDNDPGLITMSYTLADGTSVSGSYTATEWLQMALANVATPQDGSPGELRAIDCAGSDCIAGDAGESHTIAQHGLEARDCVYADDDQFDPAPTYKFCEFALLNKANTHESRVHHVEVPNGLVGAPANGYAPVDVGFVWITELGYQIVNGNTAVTGMNGSTLASLGIPNTNGVNGDKIYSLALLATSKANQQKGRDFINFIRSPDGQAPYVAGGFTGMIDQADLDKGFCYSDPRTEADGKSHASKREEQPGGQCPDWLGNGSF